MRTLKLFRKSTPRRQALKKRLGVEFFDSIPASPGVYKMFSKEGDLLYVGKAKSLRSRLFNYKNASRENSSRKVLAMLALVDKIEFEICEDERSALILENQYLRELRPSFNVVNTRPDRYRYFLFEKQPGLIKLKILSHEPEGGSAQKTLYGAFKGRYRTEEGMSAIQRSLYFIREREDAGSWPARLFKDPPSYEFLFSYSTASSLEDWIDSLQSLLEGESSKYLEYLEALIEATCGKRSFTGHLLSKDIENLRHFYEMGPLRNTEIYRAFGLESRLIKQSELDDYLVKLSFGKT